jgi:hypothetical protein
VGVQVKKFLSYWELWFWDPAAHWALKWPKHWYQPSGLLRQEVPDRLPWSQTISKEEAMHGFSRSMMRSFFLANQFLFLSKRLIKCFQWNVKEKNYRFSLIPSCTFSYVLSVDLNFRFLATFLL